MPPYGQAGSVRDRTAEFNSLADRLRSEQGGPSTSGAPLPNGGLSGAGGASAQASEFARRAARIGQGIHTASQKLFKLSQLAKRSSMFDDPAQEIAELSASIKVEIQQLNAGLADLQSLSAVSREDNKHSANHSHSVVDNLRARLKDTAQDFSNVLNLRKENLKVHQGRRQLFSATDKGAVGSTQNWRPSGQTFPAFGSGSSFRGNLLANGPSSQAATSEQTPLLQQEQQQQQQQMALAAPEDTYLTSRAEALHNVEATIHELGGIFQQLAVMVHEQGELAIRIDENVEDTLSNVDSAQAQLLKYLRTVSSNRWLIMKVFFVLMVFLVIFVVFVA